MRQLSEAAKALELLQKTMPYGAPHEDAQRLR